VECYPLFVRKHIIFHMVCRCTQLHAALVIPNENADTIMRTIDELWVSTHGPMRDLIVDC
jgi:hypothetical protein